MVLSASCTPPANVHRLCHHRTEQARCPRTSSAFPEDLAEELGGGNEVLTRSVNRADAAWPPAVGQQLRLLGEVFPDELRRRFEAQRPRAFRVGHLELVHRQVVGGPPDLADDQVVVTLEEPEHVVCGSKTPATCRHRKRSGKPRQACAACARVCPPRTLTRG